MLGLVLKLAIEWRIAQLVSVLNTLFKDWFEFAAGAGITDQKGCRRADGVFEQGIFLKSSAASGEGGSRVFCVRSGFTH
jgi:hypothetical protein